MTDYLPVADQINFLFSTVLKPDRVPYTLLEVSSKTGISAATISQLRTGKIANPQINTLRSIGEFFGVPLSFFDTRSIEECHEILNRSREDRDPPPGIHEIAYMAADLSPEAQQDLIKIIRWAQVAEQEILSGNNAPAPPDLER